MEIVVPDLTGKSVRDAYSLLQKQGITLKVERPNGTIGGAVESDFGMIVERHNEETLPGAMSQFNMIMVNIK